MTQVNKNLLLFKNLKILWFFIEKKRKIQLSGISILMFIASITEIIGIGAVFPFLTVLVQPELINKIPLITNFLNLMGFENVKDFLLPLTIFFIFMLLLNGLVRLLLLYFISKISFILGADIGLKAFTNCLNQDYEFHINRNSSEIINSISQKTSGIITGIIFPVLNTVASILIFSIIFLSLFILKPLLALITIFIIGFFYFLVMKITRLRLKNYSIISATQTTVVMKSLQESLSSIKNIIIDGSQAKFLNTFHDADYKDRIANSKIMFISSSPRFTLEAIGMSIIALIGYFLSLNNSGIISIIPILGALVLATQRMLPLLQQIFNGWASIQGSISGLRDVMELLELPVKIDNIENNGNKKKFNFQENVELKNISFKYKGSENYILKNINFKFNKNSRLGIIGYSGSGKTTLINILLGLLKPVEGCIKIDNQKLDEYLLKEWQSCIAHVPQNIFLADATITENIALSIEKENIDMELIKKVSKMAHLHEFINSLPLKYSTELGERGSRISVGQQQRIGIARALYKKPELIIFDEATNALDEETEKSIIKTIEKLGKEITIISISHKKSILENCDKIIEIKNGLLTNPRNLNQH